MSDRCASPRAWGVSASADWEAAGVKPPDQRDPYPGELEFLQSQAVREIGHRYNTDDRNIWKRSVARAFYRLVAGRRIYIEGM